MEIVKAVIPAAGLGTRFLPYTKAIPKEMVPLLNKPAIHYSVEEGVHAGITNFLLITNYQKQVISTYFDSAIHLESMLQERNKQELLANLDRLIRFAQFTYINQSEPLGLGHALWVSRHAIHKEYFAVMLPDDIIVSKQPALGQLMRIARQEKATVIAVQEVPVELISSYGIINIKKQITSSLYQVSSIHEKPPVKDAPSNLAVIGRYILSPKIFNSLEWLGTYGTTSELQLTEALSHMIQQNERVIAYKLQGIRYDIGTPVGWVKAVISLALQDPLYAPAVQSLFTDHLDKISILEKTQQNTLLTTV